MVSLSAVVATMAALEVYVAGQPVFFLFEPHLGRFKSYFRKLENKLDTNFRDLLKLEMGGKTGEPLLLSGVTPTSSTYPTVDVTTKTRLSAPSTTLATAVIEQHIPSHSSVVEAGETVPAARNLTSEGKVRVIQEILDTGRVTIEGSVQSIESVPGAGVVLVEGMMRNATGVPRVEGVTEGVSGARRATDERRMQTVEMVPVTGRVPREIDATEMLEVAATPALLDYSIVIRDIADEDDSVVETMTAFPQRWGQVRAETRTTTLAPALPLNIDPSNEGVANKSIY